MAYEFIQDICLNKLFFVLLFSLTMFKIGVFKKVCNTRRKTEENTCVGVGSLFTIKLQAQWLLLIGVKFTLKNVYADAN